MSDFQFHGKKLLVPVDLVIVDAADNFLQFIDRPRTVLLDRLS